MNSVNWGVLNCRVRIRRQVSRGFLGKVDARQKWEEFVEIGRFNRDSLIMPGGLLTGESLQSP